MSTKKFTNVQVREIHLRLMEVLRLSRKTELAQRLKITIQTMNNRESRGVNSLDDIELLCNREGISKNWVFYGAGEHRITYPKGVNDQILFIDQPEISINPEVSDKIKLLLAQMSEDQQRDVLKYAEEKKLLAELMEERKKKKGS